MTEELHKYELAASHLTLNMPSTNSYIEYGSTIYYINSENQLCTYPTGLYVYDNDGTPALNTYENNHNGGTPVSITEGNIAGTYNIGIGNAKIDNAEVSSVGTLSVAVSAAGITTFVAPVAVTLPYELTTTEIFIGQHMDDMLTMTQAEGGATFAAGTGFIIVSADSHVKFRIAYADHQESAITEYSSTFSGSPFAFVHNTTDGNTVPFALATPATTETASDQKTVTFKKINHGEVRNAYTAFIDIDPAKYAEETLSVNLEGNTTTDLSDLNVDDRKDSRAIYDIMGRKLSAPVKGINIIDGKKYMY